MAQEKDIRWKQRFNNYNKTLEQLNRFILKPGLSEMEEQGLIKSFEYTYELAWNVLKDFLHERGTTNIFGSRDAIIEAFRLGLISNGEAWMEMYKDRNRTAHTYNESTAKEISMAIRSSYIYLFNAMQLKMQDMLEKS